jgi:hypothetical protein
VQIRGQHIIDVGNSTEPGLPFSLLGVTDCWVERHPSKDAQARVMVGDR